MRERKDRGELMRFNSAAWTAFLMAAAILCAAVLAVRPARAELQNDLIGFPTNHVFEGAEAGENVDSMSGNVSLTIPIGPRFKLSETFSYGLTLYYNSKVWDHDC